MYILSTFLALLISFLLVAFLLPHFNSFFLLPLHFFSRPNCILASMAPPRRHTEAICSMTAFWGVSCVMCAVVLWSVASRKSTSWVSICQVHTERGNTAVPQWKKKFFFFGDSSWYVIHPWLNTAALGTCTDSALEYTVFLPQFQSRNSLS
jgi:hypothetical protein